MALRLTAAGALPSAIEALDGSIILFEVEPSSAVLAAFVQEPHL